MRLKNFLNEKTFNIDGDVDYLYNEFFEIIGTWQKKNEKHKIQKFLRKNYSKVGLFSSGELISKESEMAHELNPVDIYLKYYNKEGSHYVPTKNIIQISIPTPAMELILAKDVEELEDFFPTDKQKERFWNDFSEQKLKGTIYHELSHWLNDTLHNFNLTKIIKKAVKDPSRAGELMRFGASSVSLSNIELDAQIHAIKELKRKYALVWDDLSLFDLAILNSSFHSIFAAAVKAGEKEYKKYFKSLVKRLNRENLLGKNMKIVSLAKMKSSLRKT